MHRLLAKSLVPSGPQNCWRIWMLILPMIKMHQRFQKKSAMIINDNTKLLTDPQVIQIQSGPTEGAPISGKAHQDHQIGMAKAAQDLRWVKLLV